MTPERLCKQCLRWLPEEAFPKGALNPNGKPFVRHVCGEPAPAALVTCLT